MKAILGGLAVLALAAGAGLCPAHIRAQAAESLQVPEETRAELARQMDHFIGVMRPDMPDLRDAEPVR